MKSNHLRSILLLLLISALCELPAQQSEVDRWLLADVRARAEKGDAQAQADWGTILLFGNLGVAKDEVEGVKWYRKAAEQDQAFAQGNLGACYANGVGVAKDEAEAVKWYRKAAERNYLLAQSYLGTCYANGIGVAKDEVEAVRWFRRAADQNLALAQANLGTCYMKGLGVAQDKVEAVRWYRKAAEQEDAESQYNLGVCYDKGFGVGRNEAEAVKWYRKAAGQSFPAAQNNLGACYRHGQGVAKDEVEAVKWFRQAAAQDYAEAQFNLGASYATGQGVAKDEVEALKWVRQAAEQNLAAAQANLGAAYANGLGVAKDEVEGVTWSRKAAEQNDAGAQKNLGICYFYGKGVAKDEAEAAKWFRKAAEQNDPEAQYYLGGCYFKGQGVAKDEVEAYQWGLLAAAQGYEEAKRIVGALVGSLTPKQILEGQKLARNFKPIEPPPAQSVSSVAPMTRTRGPTSGTGFFITDDGYLITSEDVVRNMGQARLVTSAGIISAKVVKVDTANDLALLKAEGKFAALPVAVSGAPPSGSTVATVGFPNVGLQGFAPKLAKGVIAAPPGTPDNSGSFPVNVPLQEGNVGGALVDERGNVVGVVFAKPVGVAAMAPLGTPPEKVNYAVKSRLLLRFLESVPDLSAKLKAPGDTDRPFEEVIKTAEQATVLVLGN